MNNRIGLILLILLISSDLAAQVPETTYLGNVAVEGYVEDESYGPFNIGFNFTFFGNSYNQFYINSNGQVLFGEGSFESTAVDIPNTDLPNNYIAPFWDDLVVDSYGKILYTTIGAAPNRKLIIQFKNMGFSPFPANLGTFSVILYETSNIIQVQYRLIVLSYSTKAHGENATIGLENTDGTAWTKYAFHNPSAVNTEQAISFTPETGTSYAINSDAVYDGVYLTTNLTLPEPGIPTLISPPLDAVIGADYTFEWGAASNAASYTLYISSDPELADAVAYEAGSNLTFNVSGLILDHTYYWGVFARNTTGTTWCEIKRFITSSSPPLAPVPQTIWAEQSKDKTINLKYTGGDGSTNTAIITSLPSKGLLYQYNGGVRDGDPITVVPANVSDPGKNIIYSASGGPGNGIGNFKFKFFDDPVYSSEGMITVNVSPPGVPNVLYVAKTTSLIEIQFDIPMANIPGNEGQFIVTANGTPVNIGSINIKDGDPYTLQLMLSTPIIITDNILISYNPGSVAGLTGGLLLPFTDEPVTLIAQTISFTQSLTKKFSDSPFALNATSSSGQGMTFSSSNLTVATITSNVATFHAIGNSDITARQSGNSTYAPARYIKTLNVAKSDQTINFGALTPKILGDPDYTIIATSTSGLGVTFSSNNASVATVTGNTVHIVGGGTAVITASQPGNEFWDPAADVPRTLSVSDPSSKTLNLTVFFEGFYNGAGGMFKVQGSDDGEITYDMFSGTVTDTLTVQIAQIVSPYQKVFTAHGVPINTDGTISLNNIPSTFTGNFYIIIKHRNHIETWSQIVSFAGTLINYNLTDAKSKAWGDNMKNIGSIFCILTGDTNGDQYVDGSDLMKVFIDNKSGNFGYQVSDINGDGFVDGSDLMKVFINNKLGAGMNTPEHPLE
jgi:hypothetical protein